MRALGLELGMLDLEELSAMLASHLVTSPVRYVCAGYASACAGPRVCVFLIYVYA